MGAAISAEGVPPEDRSNQRVLPPRHPLPNESEIRLLAPFGVETPSLEENTLRFRRIDRPMAVRKDSVEIIRNTKDATKYAISFTYDAKCEAKLTIYFLATESTTSSSGPQFSSELPPFTGVLLSGENQLYLSEEEFDLEAGPVDAWKYSENSKSWPIVIEMTALKSEIAPITSFSYLGLYPSSRQWAVRLVKQKLLYGSREFEMLEMYGLSNNGEENARECVICLSEERTTVAIPCRHMCLCENCANIVRMRSNRCPICRKPVQKLIHFSDFQRG